ncbi:MAG: rod shape-determining protein RodA [Rhodospirillales bacterium CG15_BIG_FIL_POST_REV_8_21_14_020_66_15]|nr:MAG: rod shape-determining protein RodA [Rhodospirillales bacterium CG15_BIG_FIL_POST_REV_8_21_14_020_66_15]
MAVREDALNPPAFTLRQKLWQMHWLFILLLAATASVGFVMLYSAAGGNLDPWASRQMMRFGVGMAVLITVAVIDIRLWLKYAYVFYLATVALLVAVEFMGEVGKGAQRWLDLGYFGLQPSELMKIALVLALARYFHGTSIEDVRRISKLFVPVMLISVPAALVLRQPDLGTAMMLAITGAVILFAAGVRIWKFVIVGLAGVAAAPIAWQFLRDYQKQRVLTFLNPETDPLGSGYHIIQSKIAFGSGGLLGKGFLQGTQSHLNFLPEMQTDFIFTMLAEEFGMVGGLALLGLYLVILIYGLAISVRCRTQFGRLVGIGVTSTFFLYVFINMAMVMGLVPVVGVPLPLISYGGTAMLTLLFGFGLLMGVWIHRDVTVGRRGLGDDA